MNEHDQRPKDGMGHLYVHWWPGAESNHRHADFQSPRGSYINQVVKAGLSNKIPSFGSFLFNYLAV